MALFHCMMGIAGAGKTTYIKQIAGAGDFTIISPDEVEAETNKKVLDSIRVQLQEALINEENIIFDGINLTRVARKQILREIKRFHKDEIYLKVLHYFPISAEDAINRQAYRAKKVPASTIIRQQHKLEYPTFAEGWDGIIKHTIDGKVDAHYTSDYEE